MGKTLANCCGFAKFAKVFPRHRFVLYGILTKLTDENKNMQLKMDFNKISDFKISWEVYEISGWLVTPWCKVTMIYACTKLTCVIHTVAIARNIGRNKNLSPNVFLKCTTIGRICIFNAYSVSRVEFHGCSEIHHIISFNFMPIFQLFDSNTAPLWSSQLHWNAIQALHF